MKTIYLLAMIAVLGLSVIAQTKADLIPADAMFTPDARASEYVQYDGKRVPIQEGTLNGIPYSFYLSDGSGTFGNGTDVLDKWRVACKKDAIDDSKYCYAIRDMLFIFAMSNKDVRVSIGGDYPGSVVAIRVDENPAIKSTENAQFYGAKNLEAIKALSSGKQVTIRYQTWPNSSYTDKTFDLNGYNEAVAYIRWAVKVIK